MSERKWKPGPWFFGDDPEGDYPNKISIHTEDNFYIAVLDNSSYEESNAHLIAAAPELYEALERLMVECVLDGKENEAGYDCWIHHAKAALAKARGEA